MQLTDDFTLFKEQFLIYRVTWQVGINDRKSVLDVFCLAYLPDKFEQISLFSVV